MGDKVRHTTERGGNRIRKHQLPRASVGYEDLSPALRRDVTLSRMAARAARATKQVGDILEYLKDLTLIGGVVTAATENTITDNAHNWEHEGVIENFQVRVLTGNGAGQIRTVVKVKGTTLTVDPPWSIVPAVGDTFEVASSSRITSRELGSIVTTLNQAPDAPIQFSAIKQTADEISSIVALLNSDPDAADQFSAITQLASEIDLRVHKDEVITAINLSPEGVAIQANKVEFLTQPIPKAIPQGATLFHFDHGLHSTGGLAPLPGYVATLRPGEGRFGGAVAVEEGTTNLYNNPFFQNGTDGWHSNNWGGGGKIYVEAMKTPVGNSAMIMDNAGATADLVLIQNVALPDAVSNYTVSLLVKNLSSQPCTVQLYMGNSYYTIGTVNPGDGWVRLTRTYVAGEYNQSASHHFRIGADRKIAIAAIQLEQKPFATSFVNGTRAAGKLSYNLPLTNPHTGHLWMYAPYRIESVYYGGAAKDNSPLFELIDEVTGYHLEFETWHNRPFIDPEIGTYTSHRHKDWIPEAHTWYGITWKLLPDNFIVEVRDVSGNLIQTWDAPSSEFAGFHPTQLRLGVFGGAVLIDELLILPYAASEEEIRSWYEQAAPFYDPAQQLQALDNQIWIDSTGLNMQNVASPNKMMNLNANRLAFWDADGEVVAGIGNIDDLIQQLDPGAVVPGMGVLIAQGAFLATQGVLRDALADFSVSREKLEGGSIAREHLTDEVVGFVNLAKDLSVADTQTFIRSAVREEQITTRSSTQWASYLSYDYGDDLVENIRIDYNATTGSGTGYVRVLVNGQVVYTDAWTGNRGVRSIYIDLRSVDSPHVDFQWRFAASGGAMSVFWAVINRNARYAIVPAPPSYYVEQSEVGCIETCEISCQSTCEERCESSCQRYCQKTCENVCQEACQSSCQTSCQNSCQSTCEKTAQGGCFVDGTPVTVYDPETGEISEIPIEDLKPGMFMPYYEPQTDKVLVSECISNTPSITATLYEITVEAPDEPIVLRATPEQPFDVWRKNRLTGEWGWSVIPAQYLKPGDKMIRPFDEGNRMPNVISVVKLPPQPPTRVWDPKTVSGRYIVAGFADPLSKSPR